MSNWANIPQRVSELEKNASDENEIREYITKLEDKVKALDKLVKKLENTVNDLAGSNK